MDLSRASAAGQASTAASIDTENAYADSGNSPPAQGLASFKSPGLSRRIGRSPKHFSSNRSPIVSPREEPNEWCTSGTKAARQVRELPTASSLPERLEALSHALTAKDLAQLLQVSVVTIYKLAKASKLPSFRISTAVRFDPHEVARWLRQT